MPTRRTLRFETLDAVCRDVEHLHRVGYDKVGNWDLAQVCYHLADWLRFPIEGFPKSPWFMGILRICFGRSALRKVLATGEMQAGMPTIRKTIAKPKQDEAAAVERLIQAATRLQKFNGVIVPSPFFGPMTKDEALAVQRAHCGLHLSFLIPKQ